MAQSKYFCPCGALTQDLFYKCNKDSYGRQTHHMPGKYQRGRFQNLRKVCPQCDAHFSKCKRHPQLGYQPWRQEQRVGRQCKARMWVLCCERCEDTGTAHVSSVLCPGCKAPFANKGPKWYKKLGSKCKHANTLANCYKQMEKQIVRLMGLGEDQEDIIDRLKNLQCFMANKTVVKTEPNTKCKRECKSTQKVVKADPDPQQKVVKADPDPQHKMQIDADSDSDSECSAVKADIEPMDYVAPFGSNDFSDIMNETNHYKFDFFSEENHQNIESAFSIPQKRKRKKMPDQEHFFINPLEDGNFSIVL